MFPVCKSLPILILPVVELPNKFDELVFEPYIVITPDWTVLPIDKLPDEIPSAILTLPNEAFWNNLETPDDDPYIVIFPVWEALPNTTLLPIMPVSIYTFPDVTPMNSFVSPEEEPCIVIVPVWSSLPKTTPPVVTPVKIFVYEVVIFVNRLLLPIVWEPYMVVFPVKSPFPISRLPPVVSNNFIDAPLIFTFDVLPIVKLAGDVCDVPIKMLEVVAFANNSLPPVVWQPKIRKSPVLDALPSWKNPVDKSYKYTSFVSTTARNVLTFTIWLNVVIPFMEFVDEVEPNVIVPVVVEYNETSPAETPAIVLHNILFVKVFVPESVLFDEREG